MRTKPLRPTLLACLLLAGAASAWAGESAADLQFNYAQGLYRDGLRKLAITELGKFVNAHAKDPRVSRARFFLGECLRQGDDLKGAVAHYEAAVKDAALPDRPEALYRLGDCRFRLGDVKGSVAPLREFIGSQLASQDHKRHIVHATYALARAEMAERRYDLALLLFQRVLADTSKDNTYKPYVLLPIGDCLAALKRPTEALAHYAQLEKHLDALIGQTPASPQLKTQRSVLQQIRMKMANVHLAGRKYAEALALFAKLPDEGEFAEEALYGRTQALFFLQRYPDALAPAMAYLKRFPKGRLRAGALYIAAEAHYRTDKFAEAERLFAEFLAADKDGKHPARETAAFGRVAAAYRQGKDHAKATAAAADFYLGQFAKGAHLADVHYFRAEAAFWLVQYDAALAHYQKVPEASPHDEEVAHQAAVCLDLLKRAKDAALAYDVYVQRYPKGKHHQAALERAARLWGQLDDYVRAAPRYGAFFAQYAKAAPAIAEEFLYRKGACEYEAKQYDAMHGTFTSYFDQHPGGKHKHDVLYFLAWYYDEQKKRDAAAAPLYKLCAGIPGRYQTQARLRLAHAYSRLAQARLAAKKTDEANAQFLAAATTFLELMRASPDVFKRFNEYLWTAETFRKLGRKAEATEAYERLIQRFPAQATPVVVYWLGEMARSQQKPDPARAEKYFALFLATFPKHEYTLWATFGLAETLMANTASPNHAKAGDYYRKVMALAPLKLADPAQRTSLVLRCHLQLGRIAMEQKQWAEASEHLRRVGYLGTGDAAAEALYLAGHATHHQNDVRSAIAVWQRLLRHHGKSAWTERLKKELSALGLQLGPEGNTIVKEAPAKAPAKP